MTDIVIAESTSDKKIADNLVVTHHGYVASARIVGRCIKYLILQDNTPVGSFWLGSGFKPTPKDILNWMGTSQQQFDPIFNTVADNKRFVLAPHDDPNLGSRSLAMIRRRAAQDWQDKYGDVLVGVVTTVGAGRTGSVYLADNWELIGQTAGLPPREKSVSMKWNTDEEIAERFVKPTGENRKLIYGTKRLRAAVKEDT